MLCASTISKMCSSGSSSKFSTGYASEGDEHISGGGHWDTGKADSEEGIGRGIRRQVPRPP